MTPLRQRMLDDMRLHGFSERTQEAYARSVRQLAEHYGKSPDLISDEEFRQYFVFVLEVKRWSRRTMTLAMCGIKFFFEKTLNRDWLPHKIIRPAPPGKLPVVLNPDEVRKILNCVHLLRYRVCLTTIYSCGLRLSEGVSLQVSDVDSSRMMLHIHVHCLVPAGGVRTDGTWVNAPSSKFLVPIAALRTIFRAKMKAALAQYHLLDRLDQSVWKKPWVVHAQPAGQGDRVLGYLGRYLFRVAISNSRLERYENDQVSFRYFNRKRERRETCCLEGDRFIQRFLQHVLPRGFHKVRYYGIFSPSWRKRLNQIRKDQEKVSGETQPDHLDPKSDAAVEKVPP